MVKRGLSRDRVVAIAHEYVAAHGLDALTMRRLAAAAEVTPGALYKHVRDRKDLQRGMADVIHHSVDLVDLGRDDSAVGQVIVCCERMRATILGFRDGGRIVAGSCSPSAATSRLSGTLMRLLKSLVLPGFQPREIAMVLRSFTIGFVVEEQAYLEFVRSDEGAPLSDGERDRRFAVGLAAILAGTVADRPV